MHIHFFSFHVVFKKDLEKDVAGDTSGDVAKLLLALVQVKNNLLICNSCDTIVAYANATLLFFTYFYIITDL